MDFIVAFVSLPDTNSYNLSSMDKLELETYHKRKESGVRWRIVRNKWNLAYTLINNPSLCKYRKGRDVEEEKKGMENEMEIEEKNPPSKEECLMTSTPIISI